MPRNSSLDFADYKSERLAIYGTVVNRASMGNRDLKCVSTYLPWHIFQQNCHHLLYWFDICKVTLIRENSELDEPDSKVVGLKEGPLENFFLGLGILNFMSAMT